MGGSLQLYTPLREVRGILVPELRQRLAAVLAGGPTIPEWNREVHNTTMRQWVTFHWREGNPYIHPRTSM